MLKADYALAMQDMLKTKNHPNKEMFTKKAEEMAVKLSSEAEPYYDIVSHFHDLAELLSKSSYKMNQVEKFRNRKDVTQIINRVRELVENYDPES